VTKLGYLGNKINKIKRHKKQPRTVLLLVVFVSKGAYITKTINILFFLSFQFLEFSSFFLPLLIVLLKLGGAVISMLDKNKRIT
jgi:hypothetical protein